MRLVALRHVKGRRWHTKSLRQRIKRLNECRLSQRKHALFLVPRRSTRQRVFRKALPKRILENDESGLQIHNFGEPKGRGILASQIFKKHDPIVEYIGKLLFLDDALLLEDAYPESTGCFMYFFQHRGKDYCIDASEETHHIGRLINHSRRKPNCSMKAMEGDDGRVRLILFAKKNITFGQELLYDYGERKKHILSLFPWLAF